MLLYYTSSPVLVFKISQSLLNSGIYENQIFKLNINMRWEKKSPRAERHIQAYE